MVFFYYNNIMNVKFLEKIIYYRQSTYGKILIRTILNQKIRRQMHLIKHPFERWLIPDDADITEYMLYEARAAHHYWMQWRKNLTEKVDFPGRKHHHKDPVNQLLDIGYHFLTQEINKRCIQHNIPVEIGILHRAHSTDATPLIYDLMEWLRPTIDHVIYTYFRKKKHAIKEIDKKSIGIIINKIKCKLEKKYYHQKRKHCISLSYWIDIYLLSVRHAIMNNTKINISFPPVRNDTRCTKKPI